MMGNSNSSNRKAPKYKKAIKLDSKLGAGGFSLSHAPAMLIPLLIGSFLFSAGMPTIPALLFTFWAFSAFLFAIKDKPERFIRRMFGARRKHWSRKLARSKSLFNK